MRPIPQLLALACMHNPPVTVTAPCRPLTNRNRPGLAAFVGSGSLRAPLLQRPPKLPAGQAETSSKYLFVGDVLLVREGEQLLKAGLKVTGSVFAGKKTAIRRQMQDPKDEMDIFGRFSAKGVRISGPFSQDLEK